MKFIAQPPGTDHRVVFFDLKNEIPALQNKNIVWVKSAVLPEISLKRPG